MSSISSLVLIPSLPTGPKFAAAGFKMRVGSPPPFSLKDRSILQVFAFSEIKLGTRETHALHKAEQK